MNARLSNPQRILVANGTFDTVYSTLYTVRVNFESDPNQTDLGETLVKYFELNFENDRIWWKSDNHFFLSN